MKIACKVLCSLQLLLFAFHVHAQTTYKIAVFAPIYIDSAFDGNNYKLGAGNLPRNVLPGLEFYNGVMTAIDSLQQENVPVEVLVYDSKSRTPLSSIVSAPEFSNVSLIIASFNNRADIKPLADVALQRKIPLVSSTFPNDGGITNNPYFIVINSTLRTHCEEIYKYLQRYYALNNIVYIRRKGAVENVIQGYFTDIGHNTLSIPLKMKTTELPDSFTQAQLLATLDSNKSNIVICGTLDEAFGTRVLRTLNKNTNYPATVVGMPTWDGLKDLESPEFQNVEFMYSSPYNFIHTQPTAISFAQRYHLKYNARPSDMAFKGFESMYHFTKLLIAHNSDFLYNLYDKNFKLFNEFDIRPVLNKKDATVIDYLENHKVYFIKKQDGQTK